MSIAESIGEMIDRFQSVCRFERKPKPVCYIDLETRSTADLPLRAYQKKGDSAAIAHAALLTETIKVR